ncbi:MAG: CpXC domain-containing protein [Treponema sp.]|nr:CpXC domain-containing protein [Treponema sp.]
MKRDIPCVCENTVTVEVPEKINADEQPLCLGGIPGGRFMSFACSVCGKKHTPEFPVALLRPGRNPVLEVLPQAERASFYQRKKKSRKPDKLEFYLHGLRQDAAAAKKVPLGVYEKTLGEFKRRPKGFRSYLSVQNMIPPEGIR